MASNAEFNENLRVIEKLLQQYPGARNQLGNDAVATRLAYRYYRLAKGRWKRNQRHEARQALQCAISLCPGSFKYRLYQLHWAFRASAAQEHGI